MGSEPLRVAIFASWDAVQLARAVAWCTGKAGRSDSVVVIITNVPLNAGGIHAFAFASTIPVVFISHDLPSLANVLNSILRYYRANFGVVMPDYSRHLPDPTRRFLRKKVLHLRFKGHPVPCPN